MDRKSERERGREKESERVRETEKGGWGKEGGEVEGREREEGGREKFDGEGEGQTTKIKSATYSVKPKCTFLHNWIPRKFLAIWYVIYSSVYAKLLLANNHYYMYLL